MRTGMGRWCIRTRTILICITGMGTRSLLRTILLLLLPALAAPASGADAIVVLDRRELRLERVHATPSHHLGLALAYFEDSWNPEAIHAAVRGSARILAQCGVRISKAELVRIDAPARFHDFHTPESRELARALPLPGPTVYFVAGTRQLPAFEAEAIGRANSGSRPELRDTVWVTRGARDLDIVLAHELAHVLMDSGEHSEDSGNLMREDTAPQNRWLSAEQCVRLRETATTNGLLRPAR
jgi:hypothetical protein